MSTEAAIFAAPTARPITVSYHGERRGPGRARTGCTACYLGDIRSTPTSAIRRQKTRCDQLGPNVLVSSAGIAQGAGAHDAGGGHWLMARGCDGRAQSDAGADERWHDLSSNLHRHTVSHRSREIIVPR